MVSERKPMMAGPPPGGPANKRHKTDGMPPGHGQMPRYPQQGYSGPPGYMGWQGQYGPPPPHGWQGGPSQGPPGMYPQRSGPPMTPERGGYSYRGPPPPAGAKGHPSAGRSAKPGQPGASKEKGTGPMPPQQYGGAPGYGQWGGPQWQGGPPPPGGWHGGPPPSHYQHGWTSASQTPLRRPRGSPDMMSRGMMGPNAYSPGAACQPVGMDSPDDLYVASRGVGVMHDDDTSKAMSDKDKGRGSYKCGRCGVPKKGHVCPYQPKVKRRSGEPAPEMKSAAIQVEMDEFMTLRRLNIRIQGFPESYATDPTMSDMVVGEPRHMRRPPAMMHTADGPMIMGGPETGVGSSPQSVAALSGVPPMPEVTKV